MILRCDDAARDFKVDPEVCSQLGLQSIAVVPLRGRSGRVGVLEVFSTQSYAFSEEHTVLLGRLAGLAEAAWARGTTAEPSNPEGWLPQGAVTEDAVAEGLFMEELIAEHPAIE